MGAPAQRGARPAWLGCWHQCGTHAAQRAACVAAASTSVASTGGRQLQPLGWARLRPCSATVLPALCRELLSLAREDSGTPAAGRRASDAVQQGSVGLPAADAGPTAAPLPDQAEEAAVAAADAAVAVALPPSAPEQQCGEEEQQQEEEEGAEGELCEQERLRSLSKHFVFVDAPH